MMYNTLIDNSVWILRNAYKQSKAPIWRALEEEVVGPRSNRREINLSQLSRVTKDNEVAVIAGKILGTGSMDHKLSICALSVSETAAKKIIDAGGKILRLEDLVKKY